jgi:hypothetical protein
MADALKTMEVERGRAGLVRGFSARHEFPDAWHAFADMSDGLAGNLVLAMPISVEQFPAFSAGRTLKVTRVLVALAPESGTVYDDQDRVTLNLTPPAGSKQSLTLVSQANRAGGLPMAEVSLPAGVAVAAARPGDPDPVPWQLEVTHISANLSRTVKINGTEVTRIDPAKVADVAVLYGYAV